MTNTLKKNAVMILAAALAAVLLLAVVFAPVSLADNSTADSSVASAVEKTHATVSASPEARCYHLSPNMKNNSARRSPLRNRNSLL